MSLLLTGNILSQNKYIYTTQRDSFYAVGPDEPVVTYLENISSPAPSELERVAVEVFFKNRPFKMRFSMPCYPCMVTENNIHFSNGWTETYDPRASNSCEVLWDKEAEYARMWIQSQNPARIVVRVRAALVDTEGYIAHSYIESDSPYGEGDWTDEWYYIYPDGTHTRHVRIYTGLAEQSMTVTDQAVREIPPNVIHEFQEDFIFGDDGHLPEDDIDVSPVTFIKMDGSSKTFSYQPYPEDFGEFIKANIKLINLKSEYRPFTIVLPYGAENETYPPEHDLPHVFQSWPREPVNGYSVALGHTLNWWHYKRNKNILEQVYLSGLTNTLDPVKELVPVAKSWITHPYVFMDGVEPSYKQKVFDPAQRAFILRKEGNETMHFELGELKNIDEEFKVDAWIINPVFVVKNWGSTNIQVEANGKKLIEGLDYLAGYENSKSGTDLILWLNMKTNKRVKFSLIPR